VNSAVTNRRACRHRAHARTLATLPIIEPASAIMVPAATTGRTSTIVCSRAPMRPTRGAMNRAAFRVPTRRVFRARRRPVFRARMRRASRVRTRRAFRVRPRLLFPVRTMATCRARPCPMSPVHRPVLFRICRPHLQRRRARARNRARMSSTGWDRGRRCAIQVSAAARVRGASCPRHGRKFRHRPRARKSPRQWRGPRRFPYRDPRLSSGPREVASATAMAMTDSSNAHSVSAMPIVRTDTRLNRDYEHADAYADARLAHAMARGVS